MTDETQTPEAFMASLPKDVQPLVKRFPIHATCEFFNGADRLLGRVCGYLGPQDGLPDGGLIFEVAITGPDDPVLPILVAEGKDTDGYVVMGVLPENARRVEVM